MEQGDHAERIGNGGRKVNFKILPVKSGRGLTFASAVAGQDMHAPCEMRRSARRKIAGLIAHHPG